MFWAVGEVDKTGGYVGGVEETGGYVGWAVLDLGVSAEQEEKGEGEGEEGKELGGGHDWRDRGWIFN